MPKVISFPQNNSGTTTLTQTAEESPTLTVREQRIQQYMEWLETKQSISNRPNESRIDSDIRKQALYRQAVIVVDALIARGIDYNPWEYNEAKSQKSDSNES